MSLLSLNTILLHICKVVLMLFFVIMGDVKGFYGVPPLCLGYLW